MIHVEEIWWRTVSESLENKKFHFHNCFQSLLIIILLKYCCIVLDNSRLSWPSTHGDTWISGTRSCQGGDSAGSPRHVLVWHKGTHGDTWGVTHGDTWSSGTRSCQGGDSAGTPRHMLPWNYKSKHQFGTFLITTKKLKMYFFSYPVPKQAFNWPKCNYSTIRVPTIMLCFILIYLFAKSQNI